MPVPAVTTPTRMRSPQTEAARSARMPALFTASLAVALVLGSATGCDDTNKSDRSVRAELDQSIALRSTQSAEGDSLAKQKLEAAAASQDASAGTKAQVKAQLAQLHVDTAAATMLQIDEKELALARRVFEASQLAAQLESGAILNAAYGQYDPAAIRRSIDQMIADAQGGADRPTWEFQGKTTPTVAAARQKISELEEQLAKLQNQAAGLAEQRNTTLTEAETAQKSAADATGREGVEAFKRAAELRRKAADLFTQIDQANAAMQPVQRDLALAQGQLDVVNGAVTQLQAQSAQLEQAWKDLQTQRTAQVELAKRVTGPGSAGEGSAAATTVADKAREIARLVEELKGLRGQAQSDLSDAVKLFGDAYSAADELRRSLDEKVRDPANANRPEREAWTKLIDVIHPQYFKVRSGTAQRMLGSLFASEATSLLTRMRFQQDARAAVERSGAPVPAELSGGDLARELSAALKEADASFAAANETLLGVIDGSSPDEAKKAARLEQLITLYGWAQVNAMGDDKKAAEEHMKLAVERRDDLIASNVVLPALPADIAPPPPKPATTAPAAPAAPDTAAAPEDLELRAAATAFVDALDRGDLDAVKAASQVEAGQEEFLQQLVTMVTEFTKFREAAEAKFGDPIKPMLLPFDPAAQLRAARLRVQGEEGFVERPHPPGTTPSKDFAKVGGQWKVFFGEPTSDMERAQREAVPKLAAALPTLTADIQADKYASPADLMKALIEALGLPTGAPPADGSAPADAPAAPTDGAAPPAPADGSAPAPAPGEAPAAPGGGA